MSDYPRKFLVNIGQRVVVEVSNPSIITRCTENEGEWRETFYPLTTEDDVVGHLALNVSAEKAKRLDGWADTDDNDATMRVEGARIVGIQEVKP